MLQNKAVKNILIILSAAAYILLAVYNSLMAIALIIGVVLFLIFLKQPIWGLGFLIAVLPISNMDIFNYTFADIQGLKPFNLIALIVIVSMLISKRANKLPAMYKVFLMIFSLAYIANYVRSLPYIKSIYSQMGQTDYTLMNYLQNHFLKGLILFIPFVLIIMFINSKEEIFKLIYSIFISITILSLLILYVYLFATPDKGDFENVRAGFESVFQLHTNDLVNFYIIAIPILLVFAIHKKKLSLAILSFLSLFIVAILYSRTAYIIVIITIPILFIVMRRYKLLPAYIAALAAGSLLIPTVLQRLLTGVGDSDLDTITAGRLDNIWTPLINELAKKPDIILFGGGQNYIYEMEASKNQAMLNVGHAHNMYLTTVIDSGSIVLVILLVFIGWFLYVLSKSLKNIDDKLTKDTQIALIIAVISYMARGFTGGFIFPDTNNTFIWLSLGLGIAIANIYRTGKASGITNISNSKADLKSTG